MLARSALSTDAYDLAIVGVVGLPAEYGGFETVAEQLTRRLANRYRLQIFCTSKRRANLAISYLGADLHYVALDANGWQSVAYDVVSLWRAARRSRVTLVLGVSGCLFLPFVRLYAPHLRIVTNIDGVEWKRQKWGFWARLVLRLSERFAVRFSHVVIADNRGVQEHIQQTYGRDSLLIPYGGDPQSADKEASHASFPSIRFGPKDYYVAVCRIEPENNVAAVLSAFAATPSEQLILVGNWGVSSYARQLRSKYATYPNIEMLDPIYNRIALDTIRKEARAYIHGHAAGGTNPSLVEAMSLGLPVLAFNVNYNRYTTESQAEYWASAEELGGLLLRLSEEDLSGNARAMRRIALQHYTWEKVGAEYESALFPPAEQ